MLVKMHIPVKVSWIQISVYPVFKIHDSAKVCVIYYALTVNHHVGGSDIIIKLNLFVLTEGVFERGHMFLEEQSGEAMLYCLNPYPTAFPYGNGMVLHFYQQQESSTTKTVHKVINKRLKTYV